MESFYPCDHPKIPHRLNNLGSILLLHGQTEQAEAYNLRAWSLKCQYGHDLTSVRILYIKSILNILLHEENASVYGRLKYLLAMNPLQANGGVVVDWPFFLRLSQVRSLLNLSEYAFCVSLLKVLNRSIPMPALDYFGPWERAKPVAC